MKGYGSTFIIIFFARKDGAHVEMDHRNHGDGVSAKAATTSVQNQQLGSVEGFVQQPSTRRERRL
ncbi:hypothetical protein LR48_Vigan07g116100 [Vigna angularis]|uniref:Uncharacterized protein n=1 Tax=Phaseolus angularis TaxID=3914 RepID=A0A0L9UY16_PHAAN|nr:hypothetical protein LR48_Vigan07g116100 [Vigna angularis]